MPFDHPVCTNYNWRIIFFVHCTGYSVFYPSSGKSRRVFFFRKTPHLLFLKARYDGM